MIIAYGQMKIVKIHLITIELQLITNKLQSDFKTVVSDSTVIAELKKLGNDEIGYKSPSEIEALIQDDYRKWGNLITQTKITLDT